MFIDLVEKQKPVIKISQTNRKTQDKQTTDTQGQTRVRPLPPAAVLDRPGCHCPRGSER